ncbi:hypothetical protein MKEN_00167000 [Mycena kentingensis (nom. inval.)]|nr:hypothetical protein MKEN_00167000 [Mycena kentingensis (nom. inval.)]
MASRVRRVPTGPMTITKRAELWHSSPFTVEWLENTFNACTGPGQARFEQWVVGRYREQAPQVIAACKQRSPRGTWVSDTPPKTFEEKTKFMWNSAAVIQTFHMHAADMNLYQPKRVKAPPKRKKGETSGQWLSLIDGHRLPVIDLDLVRRMAISEYDKSRDTLERWRSDPQFFFGDLLERSKSIILSPEIVNRDAMYKQRHSIDDAFRTLVNFRSMVHGAWRDAASLCEYLAAQELHTPAAIERAYKRDTALLWRFVSVINRIGTMHRKMWANLQQLLAGSEYYRPLLKPWRDKRGLAHIDINEREVKKLVSARTFTGMDEVVVRSASDVSPSATTFFQAVEVSLAEDRSQDLKFSSAVYDAMGDFAAVTEFESQFTRTEFGDNLVKYAAELEKSGTDILQMRSVLYFMDPSKLAREDAQYWDRMGEASRSIRAMDDAWSMKTWELTMDTVVASIQHLAGPGGLTTVDKFDIFPAEAFNEMWRRIDAQLWSIAASLDRRGDGGRVAAEYGVCSPKDAKRPVASMYFFKELESEVRPDSKAALQPQPTVEYVSNIPIAREGETAAQSARAYVATNAPTTKEKVKTRGDVSTAVTDAAKGDEPEPETPPQAQFFPSQFKLGKKVMKLFHRILEPPEEEKENAPAKGEVRWGDFEKAMKRIGFEVVQTAGSSVRFDPPATTARPITFHRPHPDSLLSPQAIKWVGARLKRTYGWTTATFVRTDAEEN